MVVITLLECFCASFRFFCNYLNLFATSASIVKDRFSNKLIFEDLIERSTSKDLSVRFSASGLAIEDTVCKWSRYHNYWLN